MDKNRSLNTIELPTIAKGTPQTVIQDDIGPFSSNRFRKALSPSDERSPVPDTPVGKRPPLHPKKSLGKAYNPFTDESLVNLIIAETKEGSKVDVLKPKLTNSPPTNVINDLKSFLDDKKPYKSNTGVSATTQEDSMNFEGQLYNHCYKNIFAPTYMMEKTEGEKMRHKIKMETVKEVDSIITKTLENEDKFFFYRHDRPSLRQRRRDTAQNSTSDRSDFNSITLNIRNANVKSKILRIKKKKNTKGLMNKLNVIRDNIYKNKFSRSRGTLSKVLTPQRNAHHFRTLSSKSLFICGK